MKTLMEHSKNKKHLILKRISKNLQYNTLKDESWYADNIRFTVTRYLNYNANLYVRSDFCGQLISVSERVPQLISISTRVVDEVYDDYYLSPKQLLILNKSRRKHGHG